MISIIICSRTPQLSEVLSQNIEETIGFSYELIVIDNSENTFSIFEAYNIGIKKSKGDFWCFMHDDILLHTKNWGLELINIFENDIKIGLIGVAGAKMKTKMPSAWWDCPEDCKVLNIIQHKNDGSVIHMNQGFIFEQKYSEVVVLDGVFMIGKKEDAIEFDEKMIGFHNYDLDLSIAYKIKKFKIVVSNDILIEHFSSGTVDDKWYESTLRFYQLKKKYLPLCMEENKLRVHKLEFSNGMKMAYYFLNKNQFLKAFYFGLKTAMIKEGDKDFCIAFFKQLIINLSNYICK